MKRFLLITWLIIFLAGCGNATTVAPATQPANTDIPQAQPATATNPPPSPTTSPPTATTEPATPALPPEPRQVEFQTEDGVTLVGYYYPAAVNPAPIVVLMHWAGGDQTDWLYVGMVAWLQNRGAEIPASAGKKPFDTPYPFQPLPENLSFAVFTFDFRGYGESGGQHGRDKHILDARAAYQTAAALEGIDPSMVAGIGASIGSDAVVDGCEICAGALSLGPGNYLGMPYVPAVKTMDDEKKPVVCVAAEDDPPAVKSCNTAEGQHYQKQIYPAGGHAMTLFRAVNKLQPPIESVILDFLKGVFGLP